jgi:alginate O-acetyltransferase complex protein AlgI
MPEGAMPMGTKSQISVLPKPKRVPHQQYLPDHHQAQEPALPPRGLYPGEPEACRRRLRPFLRNLAFLGLLLLVFKVYRIDERAYQGRAFQTLATLAFLALPAHYLAPYRFKKPLFLAISIAGLFWVFGALLAGLVLTFAAVLIGVCFLPIRWSVRAAILAVIAVACTIARPALASTVIPDGVWAIVASIFMFRMMIYLYELKHAQKPEGLLDTLCYFFLLPNYAFMLFPVVDYRTMQRGYFAQDVHAVQGRGLEMMLRGTIHLLCYRLIYHDFLIPASRVHDPVSLAGYLVCNYLLYLQVSGQFHIAAGMLHLFGFQLPPTHHHYLLATSFTDYWRRINIYWKDFMVRLFFNPVVFRLKRWPQPLALALATTSVFVATWFLHAYQSYWLRGRWGFSVPDALFWGILGALVLVNVQLDARRSRSRGSGDRRAQSSRGLAVSSLQVAGTFATITLLWSLWCSPSLSTWLDMIHRGIYGS